MTRHPDIAPSVCAAPQALAVLAAGLGEGKA